MKKLTKKLVTKLENLLKMKRNIYEINHNENNNNNNNNNNKNNK